MNDNGVVRKVRPISFSQMNDWMRCGYAYQLARIERQRNRPGAWLPAGSAVHAGVERYLRSVTEGETK